MASTKCSINAFDKYMERLLEKYEEEVELDVSDVTEAVAKATTKMIKSNAKSSFNGKRYAAGWTQKETSTRNGSEWTVYNRDHYQLAHLLEHGHALRGGGRSGYVAGREHIAPAADYASEQLERQITLRVGKG